MVWVRQALDGDGALDACLLAAAEEPSVCCFRASDRVETSSRAAQLGGRARLNRPVPRGLRRLFQRGAQRERRLSPRAERISHSTAFSSSRAAVAANHAAPIDAGL